MLSKHCTILVMAETTATSERSEERLLLPPTLIGQDRGDVRPIGGLFHFVDAISGGMIGDVPRMVGIEVSPAMKNNPLSIPEFARYCCHFASLQTSQFPPER